MHSMYDVNIDVSDYQTNNPVPGATVTIDYDYDSYGWFYFANTPEDVNGITNQNGRLATQMADFRYRIIMRINGLPAGKINKELVRNGGNLIAAPKNPKYKIVVSHQ